MDPIPKTSGIYAITNTVNGKQYVGSAVNLERRLRHHLWQLRHSRHPNRKLQNAFNKYGEQALTVSILEICTPDVRLEREQAWIDQLHTFEQGYNLRPQADGGRGWRATEEQREKFRQAKIAMRDHLAETSRASWLNPEIRARREQGIRNALANPSVSAQMTAHNRAHWQDPDLSDRMRQAFKTAFNRPDVKARRSAIMHARYADPVMRAGITARNRERAADPHIREKISQALRQHYADPDALQACCERGRRRWCNPEEKERQAERMRQMWANRRDEILQKRQETRARRKAQESDS